MNSTIPQSVCRRGRKSLLLATSFLALFSLGLAGVAFGQDQSAPPPAEGQGQGQGMGMGQHMGRRPMMSVDDQVKHLTKKLNLSADQQTKLKPILEDQRKQMEAVHNDSSLSRDDRMTKMQGLRQSTDTQIKSVLNDDQQKSFDKMRADEQARMGKWRKGGADAPPPASGTAPDTQQ
jgi:protein CpxP